jgi:hypothetical protein
LNFNYCGYTFAIGISNRWGRARRFSWRVAVYDIVWLRFGGSFPEFFFISVAFHIFRYSNPSHGLDWKGGIGRGFEAPS